MKILPLAAACVVLVACSEGTVEPTGATIHLSAAQAAAITTRFTQIAIAVPAAAFPSDSVNDVLSAGADAERITVSVDGTAKTYYAVGLQRMIGSSAGAFETYHLLAFDDPTTPSEFIIANAYVPQSATPPISASGIFGGSTVFAHLIHVANAAVTSQEAAVGSAAFVRGTTSGNCAAGAGVTHCTRTALTASFTIQATTSITAGQSSHAASLATVTVPGVLLDLRTP